MKLRDEKMITILHVSAVMIVGMGATKIIMEAQNKGADKCLQLRMNRERSPHMVDIMN